MFWWKYLGNRVLTGIQNQVLHQTLAEYHTDTGPARFFEEVPFLVPNSDTGLFSTTGNVSPPVHLGFPAS
jgi:hypothetical protein